VSCKHEFWLKRSAKKQPEPKLLAKALAGAQLTPEVVEAVTITNSLTTRLVQTASATLVP
jgi:hypothetical protein